MEMYMMDLKSELEDVVNALVSTVDASEDQTRSIISLALLQLYNSLKTINEIIEEVVNDSV